MAENCPIPKETDRSKFVGPEVAELLCPPMFFPLIDSNGNVIVGIERVSEEKDLKPMTIRELPEII